MTNQKLREAAMCACKDRTAADCPGEWEPGCDLGANPAHVRVYRPAASGEPATVSDLLRRSRNLLSHPPLWWQENEASRVRLIGQLDAALHAVVSEEPNMRHPKIQALISSNARRNIELQLIEQLLDDPDCELTSMDMEYWHGLHDKLRDRLLTAAQK